MYDKKLAALELMQEWAEKREGRCLSKRYVDNEKHLEWECKEGHRFKMTRDVLKQKKNWCQRCQIEEDRKIRLQEIKNIAKQKGGACLSGTYKNLETKVEMMCKVGHKWNPTPLDIIYADSWCPHCYGRLKTTIDRIQKLANKRGGECLSKTYANSKTKLTWKCADGHIWRTPLSNVVAGTWCPKCHLVRIKTTDAVKIWLQKRYANRK
jgi:hypothetical protein